MNVHNHGSEEGPGLACREYRVGTYLIGHCKLEELANNIHNARLMPPPACDACWEIARAVAGQGMDWQAYRASLASPAKVPAQWVWLYLPNGARVKRPNAAWIGTGKPEAGLGKVEG